MFEYLALELPKAIDSAEILSDIDFYIENNNNDILIANKNGDRRSVGIIDRCIQIYSDIAIFMIEQHMQHTK
ncbi:unnamed protein product [Strongylus vulgaris]|uniref:Uncharacterized protein n=1 Tax=Strongylus vulgaris TaxID=40348 RepID=A0A3P7J6Y5_STRVU|nr:unnamed protein product [Strongylus vulgaris]